MRTKIIADSTCDLPGEFIEKFDIDIIPLYVIMDNVSYKDGLEMSTDKLIEWSDRTKKTPQTSAPTVEDFTQAFRRYTDKNREVVFISISSDLSATYQNASFAAESINECVIKIIDSRNVSVGTGVSVIKAAELAQQGKSACEINSVLEKYIPKIKASYLFDSLEFLKRGGRCSGAKALAAGVLKIKPRIDAIDGKLVPVEKFRGSLKTAADKFCTSLLDNLEGVNPDFCFIGTTKDDGGLLSEIYNRVKSANYFKEIFITKSGCIVTSHSGPNAYALIYAKE